MEVRRVGGVAEPRRLVIRFFAYASVVFSIICLSVAKAQPIQEFSAGEAVRIASDNPTRLIFVDIRQRSEAPRLATIGGSRVRRLPWPTNNLYDANGSPSRQQIAFYRSLRDIRASQPQAIVVLFCGVGRRSRQAVERASEFGIDSRVAQVIGGVAGNEADPGLALEMAVR